ncbi:MAG TPA: hypothetical protein VH302_16255, partial [Bryobacteraceae bacterium]|nr:hypothetical protein [Bryobacteraceae bacterium]
HLTAKIHYLRCSNQYSRERHSQRSAIDVTESSIRRARRIAGLFASHSRHWIDAQWPCGRDCPFFRKLL